MWFTGFLQRTPLLYALYMYGVFWATRLALYSPLWMCVMVYAMYGLCWVTPLPTLVQRNKAAGEPDPGPPVCCICLETFEEARKLRCGHLLHENCLQQLVQHWGTCCPMCRRDL